MEPGIRSENRVNVIFRRLQGRSRMTSFVHVHVHEVSEIVVSSRSKNSSKIDL